VLLRLPRDLLTLLGEADSFKPAGLILLPNLPVSTVIGTFKIPAFSGTSFAAYHLKKVTMDWKLLLIMVLVALPSAFLAPLYLLI
jgi:uncharacterized membrane protein YfcA